MKKLLVFANVWPEPSSSAAGKRMLQLLQLFSDNDFQICYACTATKSDHAIDFETLNVSATQVLLNDNSVDDLIKQYIPDVVLFDRFMTEEQFGWRLDACAPNALRILNTEDLHGLRKSRQTCFQKNIPWQKKHLQDHEVIKREIASIFRCDLCLIISSFEMDLLTTDFQVPKENLFHFPFVAEQETNKIPFCDRNGFMTIGNFMHEPNWTAVKVLKQEVWPKIRLLLPHATMNIYGAYASQKVMQLHNKKERFLIHGRAKDAKTVMQQARVCLAPLMFGAGLKGKLLESMLYGTPSVTTSIGAEGMTNDLTFWNGAVTNDMDEFAKQAIELHENETVWQQAQQNGDRILKDSFLDTHIFTNMMQVISQYLEDVAQHRQKNFIGKMLKHHRLQSTKYMSRWISLKNENNPK